MYVVRNNKLCQIIRPFKKFSYIHLTRTPSLYTILFEWFYWIKNWVSKPHTQRLNYEEQSSTWSSRRPNGGSDRAIIAMRSTATVERSLWKLYANPSCQNFLWEETGVYGENPKPYLMFWPLLATFSIFEKVWALISLGCRALTDSHKCLELARSEGAVKCRVIGWRWNGRFSGKTIINKGYILFLFKFLLANT
jgi:hypothetical protein